MLPSSGKGRVAWLTLAAAAIVVACRVWLAMAVPLTDTTEARYGEMARKMVETGTWLLAQHDYGVPYMGKPPLAFWLSAVGIELLGPGQLGPRLLILLSGVGFLLYLHRWLKREIGPGAAAAGVLVLMSSVLYFVSMAAVMTDLVLVATVDIALLAFWRRVNGGGKGDEWLFFIMIGLGLLTKGPLAGFLVAAPIVIWALLCGRVGETWQRVAWFKGALVTGLVAVPWYIAAEWQYPGFLRYFIIGENFDRFLVSNWQGDLYGSPHEYPHGTIWLFLLIGALPWSLIGIAAFVRSRRALKQNYRQHRELAVYMLIAAGIPMLLFTAAQNIIFPYALPALVPGVIAALVFLGETGMSSRLITGTVVAAVATALAFVAGAAMLRDQIELESDRALVTAIEQQYSAPPDSIYYWQLRVFSADYYSGGRATVLDNVEDIENMLAERKPFYLVMKNSQFDALPKGLQASLRKLGEYSRKAIYGPAEPVAIEARSADGR